MRAALGIVAAVLLAAFGGLILSEYQLTGLTGLASGALFGLFVGEAIVVVGGARGWAFAAAAAVITAAGLGFALWLQIGGTTPRHDPIPGMAWVAIAIGVVLAAVRVRPLAPKAPATPR